MHRFLVAAGFILLSQSAGVVGTLFTAPAISSWYAELQKPVFAPPNWVFAPVWITLYCLMGIAAFLVYDKGVKRVQVKKGLLFFFVQLVFNALWPILFFGLRKPVLALFEICALWVLILLTTKAFYKVSKPAGILMLPYLAWVGFASFLNLGIVLLY